MKIIDKIKSFITVAFVGKESIELLHLSKELSESNNRYQQLLSQRQSILSGTQFSAVAPPSKRPSLSASSSFLPVLFAAPFGSVLTFWSAPRLNCSYQLPPDNLCSNEKSGNNILQ